MNIKQEKKRLKNYRKLFIYYKVNQHSTLYLLPFIIENLKHIKCYSLVNNTYVKILLN